MLRTSRDKSNFLKITRNLVEATASCSLLTDFSFLSALAGNSYNPACTPSMEEVGSLNWKMLLLFRENNDLEQTQEYSNTTSPETGPGLPRFPFQKFCFKAFPPSSQHCSMLLPSFLSATTASSFGSQKWVTTSLKIKD